EAVRLRQLDPGDEAGNHVPRPEDLGRVEDPAMPLLAPDVALFARADEPEDARVPDLVVRMVDLDRVIEVALHRLARERLCDDLPDPAAWEAVLDRLRVATVEVRLLEAVDLARDRAAGQRVRRARPRRIDLVDDRLRLEHVGDRLHARLRPAGQLVLAPVRVDVAEA